MATVLQRIQLRTHGVYSFPDGTEVVACERDHAGPSLYYLSDWNLYGADEVEAEQNAPAFRLLEADSSGLIFRFGMPTRWSLEDLIDTGRTAPIDPQQR